MQDAYRCNSGTEGKKHLKLQLEQKKKAQIFFTYTSYNKNAIIVMYDYKKKKNTTDSIGKVLALFIRRSEEFSGFFFFLCVEK